MAVVEGRLQIRDWTDREGGKRRSAEIVADNVYFGDSRPTDAKPGTGADQEPPAPPNGGFGEFPPGFSPSFGDEDGEHPY